MRHRDEAAITPMAWNRPHHLPAAAEAAKQSRAPGSCTSRPVNTQPPISSSG